jgi:hypothetical protein
MIRKFILFFLLFSCLKSDCQNWQSLAGGANDVFYTIYGDTVNDILYATGNFTSVGGVSANYLAKWDGGTWSSIGSGLLNSYSAAHAIEIYNGDLVIVGMMFFPITSRVAKWNGAGWDSLGTNFGDATFGIKVLNNELYAFGAFETENSIYYNGIAKWDGSNWVSIGFPYKDYTTEPYIRCMAYYNGEIYAGGLFTDSSMVISNIAKYDGTNWTIVGGGIHGSMDQVFSMAVYQNELYIGGEFQTGGGNLSDGILRWDGNTLKSVGGGLTCSYWGAVFDLANLNGKLYATGRFNNIGGVPANYVASWDGTDWCSLGNSANAGDAYYSTTMNDSLFIVTSKVWDDDTVNYIVEWLGGNSVDTCGHINVGINEVTTTIGVKVYPNPSSDGFSIYLDASSFYAMTLTDAYGNVAVNVDFFGEEIKVNTENWSPGFYFLKICDKKSNAVGYSKLIITK